MTPPNGAPWRPVIDRAAGPVYLAIADQLEAAVTSGVLAAGTHLPPQRTLAETLGIDFTTVSRAYAEARRRGLIDARVGQGTFIRRRPATTASVSTGLVDLSMNLPPRFDDPKLVARMWAGVAGLEATGGLDLLLRYQEPGGTAVDRAAGAAWLAPRIPTAAPERVLVCPGAQGALAAVTGLLAAPGETILVEALTYPGFRALAAHLRINLAPVAIDAEGLVPEAFDAACRELRPKALYCTPTLHNPTTATMSLERREAIVAIARDHGVPIIEDDAYGALVPDGPPPLGALAPDMVFHIAGLAKCLSPALRVAYLVAPDARMAARLAGAIRANAAMASPLTAAIATDWIESGTSGQVLAAIQAEATARRALARRVLPDALAPVGPHGFHVWLQLPQPWTRGEFTARLRAAGIGVVASDAFALAAPPEAVRLGLGAAPTREDLARGLKMVADLLAESPSTSSMVV